MEKEWKREVDELKVQAWGKVHWQGLDRKGGGRKPGRRKVRWAEVREKGASRRGAGQSQWKDPMSDSRWLQRERGLLRGWKECELRAGPGKRAHPLR